MLVAIVNDDPNILEMLDALLSMEGYETLLVNEGNRACATIKERQPALVIQDIRMEHPDTGWHVLDELRRDEATKHIPVIIASGEHDVDKKAQQLELEQAVVVCRPFEPDVLLKKVKQLTHSTIG